MKLEAIGFPPPLLGLVPLRLRVVEDNGELLYVEKPVGVLVLPDPWYPRLPSLVEAIAHQASAGKPELVAAAVGADGLWAIHDVDPDCHGWILCARSKSVAEHLRNDLGSRDLRFRYEFLTRADVAFTDAVCELPIARHALERRMLVSHRTGKISRSEFTRVAACGDFFLWQAVLDLPRRDQLPLHALECGLPVLGDRIYARSQPPRLSQLKRDYRPKKDHPERPLHDGPAYRLAGITLPEQNEICFPSSKPWRSLIRQLSRYP